MPNLLELKEFAICSNNENALYIIKKYEDVSKSCRFLNGRYLLGGQIEMKFTDDITSCIIKEIESLLFYSDGFSWNSQDFLDFLNHDFNTIISLIEEYRLQKVRMNGLFRVIVFWLSPARKRATEKVFHPSRMGYLFNEI